MKALHKVREYLFQAWITGNTILDTPTPEPIKIQTLPLPPGISSNNTGACTPEINPNHSGCMVLEKSFQGGGFLPDGKHVLAIVRYTGAPEAPHPGSKYTGDQLIIVKTDGGKFSNGDPWKCITCGIPPSNAQGVNALRNYPQAFRDGKRVLLGSNILDCGRYDLVSDACTTDNLRMYPIHFSNRADGSGPGAPLRELRLHPDNVHLGFNSFVLEGASVVGQYAYYSRLQFNPYPTTGLPLAPRYDLVNVTLLVDATGKQQYETRGSELIINPDAISVGELRGFSADGAEVIYIGAQTESSNTDIYAAHLDTGKVRRLTSHPGYCDPVDMSPDNAWMVIADTRASTRMSWAAAMRNVPPVVDPAVTLITTGLRNNGQRRFFQPFLLDRHGDHGTYVGQQINAVGDGVPGGGAYNDPEWNAQADPKWSPDSTQIVYYQMQTTSPECGGANPLPCYASTEPYGRRVRLLLATLTSRAPAKRAAVTFAKDVVPWGTPYVPGGSVRAPASLRSGTYTLYGKKGGSARVYIRKPDGAQISDIFVSAAYSDFTDDGATFLNGEEWGEQKVNGDTARIVWFANMTQEGAVTARKVSSVEGLKVDIERFVVTGWEGEFTTTVDGQVFRVPRSGT